MPPARKRLSRVSAFVSAPPELKGEAPRDTTPLLSRGFRLFFPGAGLWAIISVGMTAGISTAAGLLLAAPRDLGWHAHEALFGYGGALLAGFLLTAVPNWTGRLPVAGLPLLGLFLVWLAGRVVLLPGMAENEWAAVLIAGAFLPLLSLLTAWEIVASRNWRNLKTAGLTALFAVAGTWFLGAAILSQDSRPAMRMGVAALIGLVMLVAGRVTPHFTRERLTARAKSPLPRPFDGFDNLSLIVAGIALVGWTAVPEAPVVTALLFLACLAHTVRLLRWAGYAAWRQPLIWILHAGYAFIPIGFLLVAIGAVAPEHIAPTAALHAWTTGAVGVTALAIMTRAIRSHAGRPLVASPLTLAAYIAVIVSAVLRVASGLDTGARDALVYTAGAAWIAGNGLFLIEYGPMLVQRGTTPGGPESPRDRSSR